MFLNPLHVSAQVLTAQELKCLATLSPTSLEYDESKVYEDFFQLGKYVLEQSTIPLNTPNAFALNYKPFVSYLLTYVGTQPLVFHMAAAKG